MLTALLHRAVAWFQAIRRLLWFFTEPETSGVHAIPITPEGRIVLVKLSYARGWRLPGGGRKADEDAHAAILRELREEIGLKSCGEVREIARFEHRPDHRKDSSKLFLVTDVVYRPSWSLEVKAVREFDLASLPADTAAITLRLIRAAGLS